MTTTEVLIFLIAICLTILDFIARENNNFEEMYSNIVTRFIQLSILAAVLSM